MEILFEINQGIARITLNRPEVYNSFNRSMAFQMQSCLAEAASTEEVRAVVISGNGKAFSAGQDLGDRGVAGTGDEDAVIGVDRDVVRPSHRDLRDDRAVVGRVRVRQVDPHDFTDTLSDRVERALRVDCRPDGH